MNLYKITLTDGRSFKVNGTNVLEAINGFISEYNIDVNLIESIKPTIFF